MKINNKYISYGIKGFLLWAVMLVAYRIFFLVLPTGEISTKIYTVLAWFIAGFVMTYIVKDLIK